MVVDASVVVSGLLPHDVHHETSRDWLRAHVEAGGLIVAPALLLPEVVGEIARRTGRTLAQRTVAAVLRLPEVRLLPVDHRLARAAAALAGRLRVGGAHALYIAAAATLRLPLVTWDVEQRDRAGRVVDVVVPSA
jgi:predicted nucleic acid-binding protein